MLLIVLICKVPGFWAVSDIVLTLFLDYFKQNKVCSKLDHGGCCIFKTNLPAQDEHKFAAIGMPNLISTNDLWQ